MKKCVSHPPLPSTKKKIHNKGSTLYTSQICQIWNKYVSTVDDALYAAVKRQTISPLWNNNNIIWLIDIVRNAIAAAASSKKQQLSEWEIETKREQINREKMNVSHTNKTFHMICIWVCTFPQKTQFTFINMTHIGNRFVLNCGWVSVCVCVYLCWIYIQMCGVGNRNFINKNNVSYLCTGQMSALLNSMSLWLTCNCFYKSIYVKIISSYMRVCVCVCQF